MIKVHTSLNEDHLEEIENVLYDLYPHNWSILYENQTKIYKLIGYFKNISQTELEISKFNKCTSFTTDIDFEYSTIKNEDWKNSYKKHFVPWNLNDFHFVPAWRENEFKNISSNQKLLIDPGMAFGTGNHETTKLCLKYLIQNLQKPCSELLIDIGCGSGIIALTASLIGFKNVHAIDNDEEAVRNTLKNAQLNQIDDIVVSKLYLGDLESANKFDVVFSNIQTDTLIQNASILCNLVNKNGKLILSGILKNESNKIHQEYGKLLNEMKINFDLISEDKNEWNLSVFEFR